jgi:hypothetical protein
MNSEKRKLSGQEKDQASIRILEKLREQLHSSNPSVRRQAAFHLSWMQEDGLEILREVLFGDFHAATKNAAAYGLRKMHGRMKKMSLDVFGQGLRQNDSDTREVCRRALLLMGGITEEKPLATLRSSDSLLRSTSPTSVRSARTGSQKPTVRKLEIKEIPPKGRSKRRIGTGQPRQRRLAKNEDSS